MICRKCGHMWFPSNEIPSPLNPKCPECGERVLMGGPYKPRSLMTPDVITDIIIKDCFHLEKNRGLQVMYPYSDKTLRYLKRIGYEVSEKGDHVLFLKSPIMTKDAQEEGK